MQMLDKDLAWCAWCKTKVRPSFQVQAFGKWFWACGPHAALSTKDAEAMFPRKNQESGKKWPEVIDDHPETNYP